MRELELILHNIRDHVEALLAVHERGAARGVARENLFRHMLTEERENRRALAALADRVPAALRHAADVANEHSLFVEDVIRGTELDPELTRALLHHVLEEHDEGPHARLEGGAGFTVGDLRGIRRPTGA